MIRILLSVLLLAQPLVADKPNVIVFMADDMGYTDAGFTGAKDTQKPHLDQLTKSGVIFRNGYVNHPFCGPSRATISSEHARLRLLLRLPFGWARLLARRSHHPHTTPSQVGKHVYTIKPKVEWDVPAFIQMAIETYDWNPVPEDGGLVGSGNEEQCTTSYDWVRVWKPAPQTAK